MSALYAICLNSVHGGEVWRGCRPSKKYSVHCFLTDSVLDEQQARALLRVLKGDRLEALYRVALSLGLRRGEVLGLRWQDIDFDTATLRIAQTVQRTRTQGLIIDTPKTKSSLRTLSIPPVLLVVKDILGHDQISTTMKYTHPTPETMRDATAELDRLFPEEEKEDQQEEQ
jgi:integrase